MLGADLDAGPAVTQWALPANDRGTVVILIGTVLLLRAGDGLGDLAWRPAVIGIGHGLVAGLHAAVLLERTPPELMGTSGGVTTLVRTVGFSVGPVVGAAVGGFRQTVAALVAITALGVLVTAAQLRSRCRPGALIGRVACRSRVRRTSLRWVAPGPAEIGRRP